MENEHPTTIYGFQKMFPNEEACVRYLAQVRWPDGFRCPRCNHQEAYELPKRKLLQCKECGYQASVTAGTVMHKTRTPLQKWFLAAFLMARHKQGISAMQLQKDLGLGCYQTAWSMCHKLRSALGERGGFPLRFEVEVDETYVGGREEGKHGREPGEKKSLVAVAVENRGRRAGSVRLQVVENASGEELVPFVEQNVEKGSAVKTDGWKGYNNLSKKGYEHEATPQESSKDASKILPWVHTMIANLKSWLRGTFHGVSKKHLQRYLNEFCYRTNRRFREGGLFFWLVRRTVNTPHIAYSTLVASEVS